MQTRVALLLAVTCVAAINASEIPGDAAEGRELALYEDGGVFHTPLDERRITSVSKLRRFIWSRWTAKRRSYAVIARHGTDAGTHTYIFIEPSDDRWHVSWRTFRYHLSDESPVDRIPTEMLDIVAVERRGAALIFRDSDGKVVTTL